MKFLAALCLGLCLCLPVARAAELPPQPARGEIPPDVLGRNRSGQDVTLSQYKGKVVIVTFWASWCGPCRSELPMLGKLQKLVGREHLEVVAINYKEDRRDFNGVIRTNKDIDLNYIHDPRGRISESYGVETLPNMFIIGADGKVAHVHRGYSEAMLEGFVKEMLALLPPDVLARPAGT
jgi:thiol-disulfide isomerase/thioredoxin